MRVVQIIAGLDDGGAEATLYRLCAHGESHQHHVISLSDDGKYGPILRKAGASVSCLNMKRGRLSLRGMLMLWKILRKERPDVVQAWMYHANLVGGLVAYCAGVKRVFWGIHHTELDAKRAKRSTIAVARLGARISSWVPQAIVCCAQRALEAHRDMGYSASKLCVISNGYDLSRFVRNDVRGQQLRIEWGVEDRWVLGLVGRFDPFKDHRNLLGALAELKRRGVSFYCVLVGRDMDLENCQLVEWVTKMDLIGDVRLLGQRSDIPDVMNALDVHVLSSSSEAFPNVVAEAMACGTPVVTTDVGDAAMMVGDTGWVALPRDSVALADALMLARRAMDDGEAWQARRAAARQRVEDNFSLFRMVEHYDALWRSGMPG